MTQSNVCVCELDFKLFHDGLCFLCMKMEINDEKSQGESDDWTIQAKIFFRQNIEEVENNSRMKHDNPNWKWMHRKIKMNEIEMNEGRTIFWSKS